MGKAAGPMAATIVEAGRQRIIQQGYSGFSFADLAADVGIRKPSIHHHFATKADLAVAVIDQSRARIDAQAAALDDGADPREALRGYAGHWERCIADGSESFCLAGVLAAEMPSLPGSVAGAVQAHFTALERWITAALRLGARQGRVELSGTPEHEAQRLMATVYGAMLAARVHADPSRFSRVVAHALRDLIGVTNGRTSAGPRA